MEDDLTPAEVARLIRDDNDGQLRFTLRSLLESGQAPVSYVRESWSEDASYFTANRGATGLVVAFCSAVGRLGVPASYFLQTMREDLYDVLVLRDPRKLHFDAGVQGLGSFLEVMHRIKTFAEVKGFREIITYGSSMGGYPALRAGLLLKANRAISMSGGYCWHVGRLIRKTKTGRAFDPLCPCFAPTTTELVAVIPSRNERDVRAFEILQRTFPKCVVVKINAEVHTLPTFFIECGCFACSMRACSNIGTILFAPNSLPLPNKLPFTAMQSSRSGRSGFRICVTDCSMPKKRLVRNESVCVTGC